MGELYITKPDFLCDLKLLLQLSASISLLLFPSPFVNWKITMITAFRWYAFKLEMLKCHCPPGGKGNAGEPADDSRASSRENLHLRATTTWTGNRFADCCRNDFNQQIWTIAEDYAILRCYECNLPFSLIVCGNSGMPQNRSSPLSYFLNRTTVPGKQAVPSTSTAIAGCYHG